jgi:hypothetical protein
MPMRSSGRQGGFTYLGLIILVTVIGLVGAATLKIDSLLRRAAADGQQFWPSAPPSAPRSKAMRRPRRRASLCSRPACGNC